MQAVQGVPKIEEGINPATWMLEVTTVGSESKLGVNFTDIYNHSKFAKCVLPLPLDCYLRHSVPALLHSCIAAG